MQKRMNAKREMGTLMDTQRCEIQNYEKEAEDLEKMEAELLHKLQETQKREKDVFGKLESAMIDASIPTKQRVGKVVQMSAGEGSVQSRQSSQYRGNVKKFR